MDALKSLYYVLKPARLPKSVNLHCGVIFHTEEIQQPATFSQLIHFCQQYVSITGKRALCTVMSPENPSIRKQMNQLGVSSDEFAGRLHQLREWADIGYHGHFWKSVDKPFSEPGNQIKAGNFEAADEPGIRAQFKAEMDWFQQNGFTLRSYSAGWWFVNPFLMKLLGENHLVLDFSFSQQPWVNNTWAKNFLASNNIMFGQSFREKTGPVFVQTLMGFTGSNYPMDFVRILNRFLPSQGVVTGMITTHDYNIASARELENTLKVIRLLSTHLNVAFCSEADFLRTSAPIPIE